MFTPTLTHPRYLSSTSRACHCCLTKEASLALNVEMVRRMSLWLEISSTRVRPSALTRAWTCLAAETPPLPPPLPKSCEDLSPLLDVVLPPPPLPLRVWCPPGPLAPPIPPIRVVSLCSHSHSGRGSFSSVPISSSLLCQQ